MINLQNPISWVDLYKTSHISQYPKNTTLLYSNFTARSDKFYNKTKGYDGKLTFFGLQGFIKFVLIENFNNNFFNRPHDEVIFEYHKVMENILGFPIDTSNISKLHKLGYLPIKIKALPEGSRVGMKVPLLTIVNTIPEFFWVTNYIETMLSAELWKPVTCATIAHDYKQIMEIYANDTCDNDSHIPYQCHDFGCRGLSGMYDAMHSSAGHLLYFLGSDTVVSNLYLQNYYGVKDENYQYSSGIRGTEHSVMCAGGQEDEFETYKRLLTDVSLSGNFSIVSDTWDLFNVITNYLPKLKTIIEERPGKTVIRPDSGDQLKIICGDESKPDGSPERSGCIQLLWEIFGGYTNSKGYKVLNDKIGLVYGDGITIEKAVNILEKLKDMGFASSNIVFGVGSYTYQYLTRDTLGFAVKATYAEFDGVGKNLFKDPVTDNGVKKSAKGLLKVTFDNLGNYILLDQVTRQEETEGELLEIFCNSKLIVDKTIEELRSKI